MRSHALSFTVIGVFAFLVLGLLGPQLLHGQAGPPRTDVLIRGVNLLERFKDESLPVRITNPKDIAAARQEAALQPVAGHALPQPTQWEYQISEPFESSESTAFLAARDFERFLDDAGEEGWELMTPGTVKRVDGVWSYGGYNADALGYLTFRRSAE